MSPAHVSPMHVSPAHIPARVPSTQATPCPQPPRWGTAAPSTCPSAASLHGTWGLVFPFNHAQEAPERAGLSTGQRVGGRAAQEPPERGGAPAWPRGAASLRLCTLGLERRLPRPCAIPAPAVPAASPAGGRAPGRGKAREVGAGELCWREQRINTQPSPSMRVTQTASQEYGEPLQQTCPADGKRSCWAPR